MKNQGVLSILGVILLLGVIAALMFGCPSYNVWRAEMVGKAEMAQAEQNRQIKIEEAKANLEAEKLNAQAEVERAKGAAAAMKEEGGALTPMYVQYLWVRQLQLSGSETIYIPTEAGIPMLEGTRNFDYDEMARRLPGRAVE
jgi:hypothetical protein